MNPHQPRHPRPSTAAPGRRNLMSALPAVTAPSEAVTAAPPPVTAAATTSATAPVMVRVNKSKLRLLETNGLDVIRRLRDQQSTKHTAPHARDAEQEESKQLSPISDDGYISPPPRLRAMQAAVRYRINQNRANRENDRAAVIQGINSASHSLQQRPPPGNRPETVRSARLQRNPLGLRFNNTLNVGPLDTRKGGKSRKKLGRRTVNRKRRLTRHRRANRRGTNRK